MATGPIYKKAEEVLAAIPQTKAAEEAQQAAFSGVKAAVPQKVAQQATVAGAIITAVTEDFDKVIANSRNPDLIRAWKGSSMYGLFKG